MAVLVTDVIENIKIHLDINDTNFYDDKLNIYIPAAFNKLQNEGVPNEIITVGNNLFFDYVMCLSYQVAQDMQMDIDEQRIKAQYITRVNILRSSIWLTKK